mgnify:FL=1
MDGSVDKNTELRNALLFFADEALGFRKSLHHLHRWFESGDQHDLELLIAEVGKEHHINFWPLINYANGQEELSDDAVKTLFLKNLYVPLDWNPNACMLSPFPPAALASVDKPIVDRVGDFWEIKKWIEDNPQFENPMTVVAHCLQTIQESRLDFTKLIDIVNMLLGPTVVSCVKNNDISFLSEMVASYYSNAPAFVKNLGAVINDTPDLNWTDALSRNQIQSKVWLLEKLKESGVLPKPRPVTEKSATTIIVGGWVGMLPMLAAMHTIHLGDVINVDSDKSVHDASFKLNIVHNKSYKSVDKDIKEYPFNKHKELLVIDTIVEHFENHGKWVKTLPKGTTVVLQGNDMFDLPDHVNCHRSLEEFLSDCGLNTILWAGELNLYKCNRFMAIGKV